MRNHVEIVRLPDEKLKSTNICCKKLEIIKHQYVKVGNINVWGII